MDNLGIKYSISVRTETNEQKLLDGLAHNDRKAIETIYKHHFNMVQSLILSNNGNGDPIAYVRDFSLDVGIPVTTTTTPTVLVSTTTTPQTSKCP